MTERLDELARRVCKIEDEPTHQGDAKSMPKTHELKCWPSWFQATWDGKKTAELRVDDRGFAAGDELILREYDPEHQTYTGRGMRRVVTHIADASDLGIPPSVFGPWVMLSVAVPDDRPAAPLDQPEAEPTRNAKDEPAKHECPYGSSHLEPVPWEAANERGAMSHQIADCGDHGWLCDRCKIDMHARLVAGVCLRLDTLNNELATIRLRGPGMHTHLAIGRNNPWYQTPAALAGMPGGQFGSAAFPPWALAEYSFPLPKEEKHHE